MRPGHSHLGAVISGFLVLCTGLGTDTATYFRSSGFFVSAPAHRRSQRCSAGAGSVPYTSPHGCSKSSRCRSPALSAHACGPCVGSCHLRAKYNLSHPMATAVRESRAFLPLPGPRLRETLCLDTLTGRWQLAVPEVPRPAPMKTACQLQWPLAQLVMWRQQRELRDARFARWRVQ